MRQATATVERLTQLSPTLAEVRLQCDPASVPRPGQFALARSPDPSHYLREALFPRALDSAGFSFEIAIRAGSALGWAPGLRTDLLGPLGSAIRIPDAARRFLLIDGGPGPGRLLPMADVGLQRGASITLLLGPRDYPLSVLPAEVEIRHHDWSPDLPDALAWADYVLIDGGSTPDPRLQALLDSARPPASRTPIHFLLTPAMPCGVGACGACAVHTRSGWRHACVDGPVVESG